MKNYQLLYSVERPMNLDYAPGFANTSDLVQKIPNLSYRKAHSLKHQVEADPNAEPTLQQQKEAQSQMELEAELASTGEGEAG